MVFIWKIIESILSALFGTIEKGVDNKRADQAQRDLGAADQREADRSAADKEAEDAKKARIDIDRLSDADRERVRDKWLHKPDRRDGGNE